MPTQKLFLILPDEHLLLQMEHLKKQMKRYGKNSNEYEQAGGTRLSEIHRG
ncbi:MAG: hypothetical protein KA314_15855 [Chloroflexi bacterium]|nr:hypothetical protein [Chloroflexota bacterium]MBP8057310.1 hypothetical protein [Chloroflexota bacterium]